LISNLDDLIEQGSDEDQLDIYNIKVIVDLLEIQLSNYWENEGDLEEFINFSETVYDKTKKIINYLYISQLKRIC